MSSRGEIVPELAKLLREIADRIDARTADPSDAGVLRRIAHHASGEDKRFKVKVHYGRGQAPWGAAGVDRRLAMAKAVKAYTDEHGGPKSAAYEALSGQFGNADKETIRKAWQEMAPILQMSEEHRSLTLGFKRLEARGLVKITRTKRVIE